MHWLSELFYSPEQKQTNAQTERMRREMEQSAELHPLEVAKRQALVQALQQQADIQQQRAPLQTAQQYAQATTSPYQAMQMAPFEQAYRQMTAGQPYNPAAAMKMAQQLQQAPSFYKRSMAEAEAGGELAGQSPYGSTPRQLLDTQIEGQKGIAHIQKGPGATGLAAELSDINDDIQNLNNIWQSFISPGLGRDSIEDMINNPDADENTLNRMEWEVLQQSQRVKNSRDTKKALLPPEVDPGQVDRAYAPLLGDITTYIMKIQQRRQQLQQQMEQLKQRAYPSQPLLPEE